MGIFDWSGRPLCFLDFETNKAGDIFLAGVMTGEVFRQVALDARLLGLAEARSLDIQTPGEFVFDLLLALEKSKGILVGYSLTEKNIIAEIYGSKGITQPNFDYCNILKAAKRWVRSHKRQEFESLPPLVKGANQFQAKRHRNSLASIMRLTSFRAPRDYAIGKTTTRINTVISALERQNGDYQTLTAVQKGKATKFLKHNEFDVKSLPVLFEAIAGDDIDLFSNVIAQPSS
jgi:hypothetical protein